MEDREIVALYWSRSETAIDETRLKYEPYLMKIAKNILKDSEDCRECVNDTYLRAWNSIPPHRPAVLSTYLGKITRQGAIDGVRKQHAARRGADSYACALEELGDTVPGGETPEQQVAARELADSIGQFLWTLPPQTRHVFLWRYYYFDDIPTIANRSGMSRAKVKSLLYRTRQQLKTHLVREGFL